MNQNNKDKVEIKKLKEENKQLQRELNKKDKALAEVTALLTLKKKLSYLWEDEEK
jgi:transposase